ncbi:MAG TPA: adenylate/guanylate cyclase domain-containing protein [Candidatus Limnocylindrales bacterium]|nr:adenylate/guanylate cyclase domain-containing protein [Candidatus Limnocylindrales bacterium]
MICSSCGTPNEPGRKFCGECGSRLSSVCAGCGSANPPSAKFCGECAAPLAAPAASTAQPAAPAITPGPGVATPTPVAERRVVSVLFADLVGFTTLAEGRDAEETRQLLTAYFELTADVIQRYGGTVEKFIGDAVMAVWGAPIAREDDAERAVRAGLDLVDAVGALGPGIEARVGILTGEAAVTIGAANQGMVAGDLVNTASRLQSVAPAGTVLVGEATQRAASQAVSFEEAGDQLLKGKASPVRSWRAVRVVAQVGGRNREAREAPFVGRETELRLLKDLFHATGREQRARLVSVIGPAGIGKSRLAWEFLKYIDGLLERVWWHDGRSPAYGDGITFWALGEMVRVRCGLLETDDEATTRAKVSTTVAEHVPDVDERRWVEQALLVLLGMETAAPSSEQLFAAWRTFFERLAATSTVVLVFEDFHFADAGLLDFVDHLLDWSRNLPIFVLVLSRPELLERRPDWGASKRSFTSQYLDPLPPDAMRALLDGLVPGLPDAAVATIVGRADGIPLYAVEMVRMLLAEGKLALEGDRYVPVGDLSRIAVPETLAALIASRLDALGAADRGLISDAAVLGQSFTLAGLAAVSGTPEGELEPRLRALVRRELLTLDMDPRSPERGQYAFVQALIREVAYNTLAKADRKVRHIAAARFFESLETEEIAGALAGHYLAAHANAASGPEADALAAQARIALRAAAERAISLGSLTQAVGLLDQARAVTADQAEVAELLERAGWAAAHGGLGDEAIERLQEAVALRRALGDADATAGTIAKLGEVTVSSLRRDVGLALLESATEELIGAGGTATGPGTAALLGQLARAHFLREQHVQAVAAADRALEAAERLDLVDVVSDVLITRGTALSNLGRRYEGSGAIRTGIELAESRGLVTTALRGRLNLGVTAPTPADAYAAADEAMEIARRFGLRGFVQTLTGNLSTAALELGHWERAMRETATMREESPDEFGANLASWFRLSYEIARGEDVRGEMERLIAWGLSFEDASASANVSALRAEADFAQGRFAEAADRWMDVAPGDTLNGPSASFLAGLASLYGGDAARARRALGQLEAVPGHRRLIALDRRLISAGLLALEGQTDEAIREARAVRDEYERMGLVWRSAHVGLLLASTIGPGHPDVRSAGESARETFARLGARPFLAMLEERLARGRPDTTADRFPSPSEEATATSG